MNLLDLPLATELSDVERVIVRAIVANSAGPRKPVKKLYAAVGRKLHLKAREVEAIERAMCKRLMTADRSSPALSAEARAECGHGAVIIELVTLSERKSSG